MGEYQPTTIELPESVLLQIRAALDSGLEAAVDCHGEALRQYGERKSLRVRWHADEVAKIEEALGVLRSLVPSVFSVS